MKTITIKSIVSISNVALYLIFILTFLAFGAERSLNQDMIIKSDYFLIIFAVITFGLYHFLRVRELKKTEFQLQHRHIFWMWIFYVGQYFSYIIALLYLILVKVGGINQTGVDLFFYIGFPIIFLLTTVISILESIIRAEERIFDYKKALLASEEWEKTQGNSGLTTSDLVENTDDSKKINPFEK